MKSGTLSRPVGVGKRKGGFASGAGRVGPAAAPVRQLRRGTVRIHAVSAAA
jgi:hypothetical protein